MITIFAATDVFDNTQRLIKNEHRLNELVQVTITATETAAIKVSDHITVLPDWENAQPPVLLPIMPYSNELLLGIVYAKLGNYDKAFELLQTQPTVLPHIDLLNRLHNGVNVADAITPETNAVSLHNNAVALHYGIIESPFSETEIIESYEKAIAANNDAEQKQFSIYQLAQLFIDLGKIDKAETLINSFLQQNTSNKVTIAFKDLQCKIGIKKIKVPYENTLMEDVKKKLWECLVYYEANNRRVEAAMVLTDASYIATLNNSFSEALGYVNRAIKIFDEEQLEELLAQAQFTKGTLLQTWAQNGNPQFYRTAIESYQEALRVFTKENAPDIFAEIQHQLGKVYAEIPDEVKKKGLWAAVSVSSFNEALNYYNKIDFPYEFAMICNSLGNAYTKYPASIHTDNFDKALAWYRESLDIRTAEKYPIERVLTLSNYLEASWYVRNKEEFDEDRYNDMMAVANEILKITNDAEMIENAKSNITKLEQIKAEANN